MTFYDKQEEVLLEDFSTKLETLESFYANQHTKKAKDDADRYLDLYKMFQILEASQVRKNREVSELEHRIKYDLDTLYSLLKEDNRRAKQASIQFLKNKKSKKVVDLEETKCLRDVDRALHSLQSFYDRGYKNLKRRQANISNKLFNSTILKKKLVFLNIIKNKISALKKLKYVL